MKHEKLLRLVIIAILVFLTYWFGVKPQLPESYEIKQHRQILDDWSKGYHDSYSIVVFGGTPEGFTAAISSARSGARTLLITEDMNLGSYIMSSYIAQCEPEIGIVSNEKKQLSSRIFNEIFSKIGYLFVPQDYAETVQTMAKREKNLDILYSSALLSVQLKDGLLDSVEIYYNGDSFTVSAPFFVDATENGTLLERCKVPFTTGSEDINVANSYMPVEFNFKIGNVDWADIESMRKTTDYKDFQQVLEDYTLQVKDSKIMNISFISQPDNQIIISGIQIMNVDVNNEEDLIQAYNDGMQEAKMLTAYLKTAFTVFEDCTFVSGPEKLYIPENRHYQGRYVLQVNDILDNRNFDLKVLLASSPVDAGKFVSSGYDYILGNPQVYSIPLGCLVPEETDNVLMIGNKISYSSLAATSAGKLSNNISMGQVAGNTLFYCLINDINPVDLLSADEEDVRQFTAYLNRSGIYLQDFDEKNPNMDHWAYPYVRILTSYGLVAGGLTNDYRFDAEANQENLALLIINMVYKAAPDMYTLEFDDRLRPYCVQDSLTGRKAAEILLKAHNMTYQMGAELQAAKNMGLIPGELFSKLTDDGPVTMEQVYYLTVHNIKLLQKNNPSITLKGEQ